MANFKGDSEELKANGKMLITYGENLKETLDSLKMAVDDFTNEGNGDSKEAGISGKTGTAVYQTFYDLHGALMKKADKLVALGESVDATGENFIQIDDSYAGISCEV